MRIVRRWAPIVFGLYAVAAIVLLLSPIAPHDIIEWVFDLLHGVGLTGFGIGWVEFIGNIVLFIPIGLFLTVLVRNQWLGAALAVVFSIAVELVQVLLPARTTSLRDVLANGIGAVVGAAIAWFIIRRHRREPPPATTRAR